MIVYDLPDGPERAPMLAPELRQGADASHQRWGDMCDSAADKYGIPRGWLDAMVWRESGGNPRAFRREPNGQTGVGLLQITNPGLKGRLTDAQLFGPSTNIDVGARYVAFLREKYGDDFPRVAAAYNAGSARPDASNGWNLHQTAGHVSSEVSFLNYYIHRRSEQHAHELVYLTEVAQSQAFDLRPDVLSHERPTEPAPAPDRPTLPDPVELATVPPKRDEQA